MEDDPIPPTHHVWFRTRGGSTNSLGVVATSIEHALAQFYAACLKDIGTEARESVIGVYAVTDDDDKEYDEDTDPERLHSRIEGLEDEIARLSAEVERWKQVASATQTTATFVAEVVDEDNTKLKARIAELEAELEQKEEDLVEADDSIVFLGNKLDDLEAKPKQRRMTRPRTISDPTVPDPWIALTAKWLEDNEPMPYFTTERFMSEVAKIPDHDTEHQRRLHNVMRHFAGWYPSQNIPAGFKRRVRGFRYRGEGWTPRRLIREIRAE